MSIHKEEVIHKKKIYGLLPFKVTFSTKNLTTI